jgi:undecaprenyl diphosphate synthase
MGTDLQTRPMCIGFIMDGNRRFAKKAGVPSVEGHRAGYQKLKEVLTWANEADIKNVIVYALSTENWNRSKEEIGYLMELARIMLRDEIEEIAKEHARVVFAGDLSRFPDDLRKMMVATMQKTAHETKRTLVICASYGGRAEILHAANELLQAGETNVNEKTFSKYLWTQNVPDPDLIIRTGGEMRLSNFLPWQSTYSELFFTNTLWPDFSRDEFNGILDMFSKRTRRHGT